MGKRVRTDGYGISAKHLVLGGGPPNGPGLEAVQFYLGPSDLLGIINHNDKPVIEVGATLGYSLGVDGRVLRWHIDHWVSGFEDNSSRRMIDDEFFDDASVLTTDLVKSHVIDFLRKAFKTSYRYRGSDRQSYRIGFAFSENTPNQSD
jgi:hypothetical protein